MRLPSGRAGAVTIAERRASAAERAAFLEWVARLRRAAEDPRVADVLAAGVRRGKPYLVVATGKVLADVLCARGALPPAEVQRLGVGLAAALTATHAAGLTHGFVCPETVLVVGEDAVLTGFDVTAPGLGSLERSTDDVRGLATTLYVALGGEQDGTMPDIPGVDDDLLRILREAVESRLSAEELRDRLAAVEVTGEGAGRPITPQALAAAGVRPAVGPPDEARTLLRQPIVLIAVVTTLVAAGVGVVLAGGDPCDDVVDDRSAAQVLEQGAQRLRGTSHRFLVNLGPDFTGDGLADPPRGLITSVLSGAGVGGTAEFRLVGTESYLRDTSGKWTKLSPERLNPVVDPSSQAETFMKDTANATRTRGCGFSGEIGTPAASFEATLDEEGRITRLSTTLKSKVEIGAAKPLEPGATVEMTFSDFGTPVAVDRPADVAPASTGTLVGTWQEVNGGHRLEIHKTAIYWYSPENVALCVDAWLTGPPGTSVNAGFICTTTARADIQLREDATIKLVSDDVLEYVFHGVPTRYRRSA